MQYGRQAVDPPPGAREEWRIFVDLAIAMRKPLFGAKGINGFIKATRGSRGSPAGRPRVRARTGSTGWSWPQGERSTDAGSNGAMLMANPHGLGAGPARVRALQGSAANRRQEGARRAAGVRGARPRAARRTRPQAPDGYPFQLANRRNRHSMNSWLNELPGLHPSGKRNEVVIHPDDAAALGITDGDRVRVFSSVGEIELAASVNDRPRRGVVIVDHGWGSRIFDPRGRRRRSPTAPTATCSSTTDRRPAVPDLGTEFVLRRRRTLV